MTHHLNFNGYLLLAAIVVGYIIVCLIWPRTRCGKCEGRGEFASPSKKNFRGCGACDGSGRKVRFGRRVLAFVGLAKDL